MANDDMEDVILDDDLDDVPLQELPETEAPPTRFEEYAAGARDILGEYLRSLGSAVRERILPERVREWQQTATRTGQWLAFLFIWVWIPICFKLLLVFHDVLTSILFSLVNANGEATAASIITIIDLLAFMVNAASWFLFVQTAGFSWFNFGEEPQ